MPERIEIRVVRRNLRWEVSTGGVTRPMLDWLCTKERALDHARERAEEVRADLIVVERIDGTIEEVLPVDRSARPHLYLVAS